MVPVDPLEPLAPQMDPVKCIHQVKLLLPVDPQVHHEYIGSIDSSGFFVQLDPADTLESLDPLNGSSGTHGSIGSNGSSGSFVLLDPVDTLEPLDPLNGPSGTRGSIVPLDPLVPVDPLFHWTQWNHWIH